VPALGSVVDAYPLSRLQAGMLFHSLQDRDTPTYHDIFAIQLSGSFDRDLLLDALSGLVARTDVLRTAFDLANFSRPMQLVYDEAPAPLTIDDLRGLTEPEQAERIERWTAEEKRTAFDLATPPLFRLRVHLLSDTSFRLSIGFHHAILDGWSLSLLISRLLTGYDAILSGRAVEDDTPATRFRDFVALEQEALADPAAREFWIRTVVDASFTALPRPSGAGLATRRTAQVYQVPLPAGRADGVRAVAAAAKISVKSVLFAVHARVLSALSGRSLVVTGRVSNGRPETSDSDRVIGLFLNTLPLVLETAGASWTELAARIHRQESQALAHRRYPLGQILRDVGRPELFEAVVDHRSFRNYEMALERISISGGEFFEQSNFPFTANFSTDPMTGQISLRINYDAARFNADRIAEIGGYYAAAFDALLRDPAAEARGSSLISDAERKRLIGGADTVLKLPGRVLPELLDERAAAAPGDVALRSGDRVLTYAGLHTRANRLAWRLRRLGVGPDILVGVYQKRSMDLLVSLLAVHKAGGAYLPLDPGYPVDRLNYMIADASASVLLTDADLVGTLNPAGAQVLVADEAAGLGFPGDAPTVQATPRHLAYVIYTSGSTGRPKGVQVTHGALVNLLLSFWRDTGIAATDRWLAVTSLSFDIAGLEIFLPLLVGAELMLAPDIAADGPALRDLLRASGATLMQATPSSWRLLVEAGLEPDPRLRVISGGETLPPELAAELTARFPVVWNAYGPTETTIWSCLSLVEPAAPVTLGGPIANTRVYVLDETYALAPEGVPGDLYIAGEGLARGYLGRAAMTAHVPHRRHRPARHRRRTHVPRPL
jgi:amino acid adenylation domain-containing protein